VRALVLQHDADAPPGLLAEWARARGWSLDVVRLDLGEHPPASLNEHDRLISLGSEESADDDAVRWQATEQRALVEAAHAGVPVLGICFGGQSLARALGGGVRRAARPEIGWRRIGTRVPELIDDGPWLEWHRDEILPPADAEVLARNESGVQAWRLGPHVGLQFHPEVDAAIVAGWIEAFRETTRVPEGLAEETERLMAGDVRERAMRLFDALLTG
jgi:GMP synthase-like glutamine amidotransferase